MKAANLHSAIHKASHETSRLATAHLRAETSNSGWPSHLSHSIGVTYGKDGFEVHVPESHHSEALDHEYGLPGQQPNPAIRRVANRTGDVETFFVNRLYKHIEDSL